MKHFSVHFRLLFTVILFMLCLLSEAPLAGQAINSQLEHIAQLVESGREEEARIRTETLLEVYPDDQSLIEIRQLLAQKKYTDTSLALDSASSVLPPVPEVLTPSLKTWLGHWIAEANVDSIGPSGQGQIETNFQRVRALVILSLELVDDTTVVSLEGQCWDDGRIHYTDGKSAFHQRRYMKYRIPGQLTVQDTSVNGSWGNPNLRNILFDEAYRLANQPLTIQQIFVDREHFRENYKLKRHAFSQDYTTLRLWIGATESYQQAEEVEVVLEFTLNPLAQSITLSSDACLSFSQYTNSTVPSISKLEKSTLSVQRQSN
jgi:hypothetical protein